MKSITKYILPLILLIPFSFTYADDLVNLRGAMKNAPHKFKLNCEGKKVRVYNKHGDAHLHTHDLMRLGLKPHQTATCTGHGLKVVVKETSAAKKHHLTSSVHQKLGNWHHVQDPNFEAHVSKM